jgi:hypothetical protein
VWAIVTYQEDLEQDFFGLFLHFSSRSTKYHRRNFNFFLSFQGFSASGKKGAPLKAARL